jgi:hypothetical protein
MKLVLDEWIVREVIDTLNMARTTLLGITGLDSPQEVAKKSANETAITRRISKAIDIIQQSEQPSLPEGLGYYNKIIDELENRSRMSAPEASKAAKWMKEFYRSPNIYPSGNVGIAENSAKPQEPQGLESDVAMLENILGTYKTLEDMLDLSTGQDQDMLESMNFEREWLKKRLSQKMPEGLEEAAEEQGKTKFYTRADDFKAGAEWMAGQGETMQITDDTQWEEVDRFVHRNCDGASAIQIRKKED